MEFNDLLEKRRAVNFFDPNKKIEKDLLVKIIEKASKVPSGFNLQPWQLIAVVDDEKREAVYELAWKQDKIKDAPVLLVALADMDGCKEGNTYFEKNFEEMVKSGLPKEQRDWLVGTCNTLYGASSERSLAFAVKNTGLFLSALMYAAKDEGVDSHPMDGFDIDGVKKALNIPDNYWVPMIIALGYFDESKKLDPPRWRKKFEEIVLNHDEL